ncbi:Dpse\GA19239-PA-like protein [Anopheles sinensis]|uniref:Dpse\GA19239-PA-like protein n=1 Tax=Anopheles sinensis TaxID=74873 RepID=A0A084W3I1_ANOSI|nr:Dpse\GA19239-PA-like protein [Anopheles sinensis]
MVSDPKHETNNGDVWVHATPSGQTECPNVRVECRCRGNPSIQAPLREAAPVREPEEEEEEKGGDKRLPRTETVPTVGRPGDIK